MVYARKVLILYGLKLLLCKDNKWLEIPSSFNSTASLGLTDSTETFTNLLDPFAASVHATYVSIRFPHQYILASFKHPSMLSENFKTARLSSFSNSSNASTILLLGCNFNSGRRRSLITGPWYDIIPGG